MKHALFLVVLDHNAYVLALITTSFVEWSICHRVHLAYHVVVQWCSLPSLCPCIIIMMPWCFLVVLESLFITVNFR